MRVPYETQEELDELITQYESEGYITERIEALLEGNFVTFLKQETTEAERLATLEEERLYLQLALAETIEKQEIDKIRNQLAIAEMLEKQEIDKLNNQLALAEVIESLTIKGVL